MLMMERREHAAIKTSRIKHNLAGVHAHDSGIRDLELTSVLDVNDDRVTLCAANRSNPLLSIRKKRHETRFDTLGHWDTKGKVGGHQR